MAKKPQSQGVKSEAKAQAPTEKSPYKAPTAEKQVDSKPAQKKGALVTVKNVGTLFHRQPSTGIRIDVGEEKEVKDDKWVKGQVDRGWLTLV